MDTGQQTIRNSSSPETSGNVSREYKSRLFQFLFGREERKAWTLSLYNALNGTDHKNPDDIQITTIEDAVYMGMKNDLSFIVSDRISLYATMNIGEQQSTYNPNLPLREFMYAGRLYDKCVKMNRLHLYGTALIPLPIPKLVVFYNGKTAKEDDTVLHLSDSFREGIRENLQRSREHYDDTEIAEETEKILKEAEPDIEVKVRMLNINYGHNKKVMAVCKPLHEYSWFVDRIRKNGETMKIGEAVDRAMDEMPGDFEIRPLLIANRAEGAVCRWHTFSADRNGVEKKYVPYGI